MITDLGAIELCHGAGFFDFRDLCVRASWSVLLPGLFALALVLFSIPVPLRIRVALPVSFSALFQQFLTLQEAEALDGKVDDVPSTDLWTVLPHGPATIPARPNM